MNPKIKNLIDSIRQPIIEALGVLSNAVAVRFKTAEDSLERLRVDYAHLKAAHDEQVLNASRNMTELAADFEVKLFQAKESLAAAIPAAPTIDLDALALAAAELVPVPKDGVSPTPEQLDLLVSEALTRAGISSAADLARMAAELIPVPKDGKTVTTEELSALIDKALVDREITTGPDLARAAASLIPYPTNGKDGKNGIDGKDGVDGIDGTEPTLEEIDIAVAKAIAAIPIPTVSDIFPKVLERVEQLAVTWELSFERRAQDHLLRVLDHLPKPKDGKDGINGKDAVSLKNFKAELLADKKTLRLSLSNGDEVFTHDILVPTFVYRGYYKVEEEYHEGDAVTFGGSLFIANRSTKSKPETDDSWRLAVKRGRDGKDGKKGDVGKDGEVKTVRHIEMDPFKLGTR